MNVIDEQPLNMTAYMDMVGLAQSSPLAQALYGFVLAMIIFYILLLTRRFYQYLTKPARRQKTVKIKEHSVRVKLQYKIKLIICIVTVTIPYSDNYYLELG